MMPALQCCQEAGALSRAGSGQAGVEGRAGERTNLQERTFLKFP